jgi:hypothetical protein
MNFDWLPFSPLWSPSSVLHDAIAMAVTSIGLGLPAQGATAVGMNSLVLEVVQFSVDQEFEPPTNIIAAATEACSQDVMLPASTLPQPSVEEARFVMTTRGSSSSA